MPTVISVGTDDQLLSLREAVLRNAGFQVLTACDPGEALRHAGRNSAAVLLLCYSLPLTVRQELAEQFRRHSPSGRIVAITNEPQKRPPIEADAFLYGIEGPEALIRACRGDELTTLAS